MRGQDEGISVMKPILITLNISAEAALSAMWMEIYVDGLSVGFMIPGDKDLLEMDAPGVDFKILTPKEFVEEVLGSSK